MHVDCLWSSRGRGTRKGQEKWRVLKTTRRTSSASRIRPLSKGGDVVVVDDSSVSFWTRPRGKSIFLGFNRYFGSLRLDDDTSTFPIEEWTQVLKGSEVLHARVRCYISLSDWQA